MLTDKQQEWLNHLSDSNKIHIVSYNPKVQDIFSHLKEKLQQLVGKREVVLKGSNKLKISGTGELDIYIPVSEMEFLRVVKELTQHFGTPGSLYEKERARFNIRFETFPVEIFVINQNSPDWKQLIAFEEYLQSHHEDLKSYEKLKIDSEGVSTKDYYRRKLIFFNTILEKCS